VIQRLGARVCDFYDGQVIKGHGKSVEYLDYQIPVTRLKGTKGSRDMQAAKRD